MNEIFQNTKKAQIINIVRELQNPKALARAQKYPVEYFAEHGIVLPAQLNYEIHFNDENTFYFVLQGSMNSELAEDVLAFLAAGKVIASTLSSLTTFSTASSVGNCLGTFGSIFTFGSVGEKKDAVLDFRSTPPKPFKSKQ